MPHDPHLADLMRQALAGHPGITEKKMFGGICWLMNGNMLAGVEKDRYMFRVGKERQAEALGRDGTSPMDFTGRAMSSIVWVEADAALDAGLDDWIAYAARFVGGLAPK